jgi:ATP-binding cassette subfamily F protein uup
MRSQLDENATLADVINPGSEWIEIGGNRKHVMSYLGDFLFAPARAQSPVKSLSGGERARLLLARLFARPANILVLDEPTNDLDIETLELLEELLQDYPGTVLLVSHDRTFLDNVVTQTIASEGNGGWKDYVGGFGDWERQRTTPQKASALEKLTAATAAKKAPAAEKIAAADTPNRAASDKQTVNANRTFAQPVNSVGAAKTANKARGAKMTPWETKELEQLPAEIHAIEQEQAQLVIELGNSELYKNDSAKLAAIQARVSELDALLAKRFERWEALEARNQ